MSATFRIEEQVAFNELLGTEPDIVCWGPMDKRNVGIFVRVKGVPLVQLIKDWTVDMEKHPTAQSLIYSNSARACDDTILDSLERAASKMESHLVGDKEFLALTGACGIMLKSYLMAAYCGDEDIEDFELPNIWCMPCTSAANCGVSSSRCHRCYRYGPCPNWHDFNQEIGRVNRLHLGEPGENSYSAYLNAVSFLSLYVRTQTESNLKVRARKERHLMQLLKFLILPTQCYHEGLEQHFENPFTYASRGRCGNMCSFCNDDYLSFTGTLSRRNLTGALQAEIFHRGSVSASKLVGFITDKKEEYKIKESIFGDADADSGRVNALVLQLFAAGILSLEVDKAKVGKDNLRLKDVSVSMARVKVTFRGKQHTELAINDDKYWVAFNLTKEKKLK